MMIEVRKPFTHRFLISVNGTHDVTATNDDGPLEILTDPLDMLTDAMYLVHQLLFETSISVFGCPDNSR